MSPPPHTVSNTISTAMVMAAGMGNRMRPLTDTTPKPLITVNRRPLIDYTLHELSAGGVSHIVVNVHYQADQLEAYLRHEQQRHSLFSQNIIISDERSELLETGGGLVKAQHLLGEDPFFCCNTDAIFAKSRPGEACNLLRTHWQSDMLALLLLVPLTHTLGFDGSGDFHLHADHQITKTNGEPADYAYTGLQILHPAILEGEKAVPFSTRELWRKAASESKLYGCVFPGDWLHVGTPHDRDKAENYFTKTQEQDSQERNTQAP